MPTQIATIPTNGNMWNLSEHKIAQLEIFMWWRLPPEVKAHSTRPIIIALNSGAGKNICGKKSFDQ